MTYNVFGGTLNLAQSVSQCVWGEGGGVLKTQDWKTQERI